jgi:hypothetical protein
VDSLERQLAETDRRLLDNAKLLLDSAHGTAEPWDGLPLIRTINELVGSEDFVLKTQKQTLKLRAPSDGVRQAIFGAIYLACPNMTQ